MKLSIVIPCYNEEENIPDILEKFSKVILRDDVELILVNNNSKDNTAKVLEELVPKYIFAKSVFEANPGYGSAVLRGLKEAKGEYLGWTHGDLQTPPEDVIKCLKIIEEKNNPKNIYVKGLRRGRSLFDLFFTLGMSVFETLYLRTFLYDINAQPNIFHRSFYEKWLNPPTDFSLDLYSLFLAKKNKLKLVRFSVDFPKRLRGESSWNKGWSSKWKFIKRTLSFSISLKNNLNKNEQD